MKLPCRIPMCTSLPDSSHPFYLDFLPCCLPLKLSPRGMPYHLILDASSLVGCLWMMV